MSMNLVVFCAYLAIFRLKSLNINNAVDTTGLFGIGKVSYLDG